MAILQNPALSKIGTFVVQIATSMLIVPVEPGYLCFLIFLSADPLWIAIWSVWSLLMMY